MGVQGRRAHETQWCPVWLLELQTPDDLDQYRQLAKVAHFVNADILQKPQRDPQHIADTFLDTHGRGFSCSSCRTSRSASCGRERTPSTRSARTG
mmetsp:Transcript_10661/g.26508  ORF Transcript_10661/g.26508 Transcript_10661/m.26508 type:complete len:95 (+) Transcript_10661:252-536(+)